MKNDFLTPKAIANRIKAKGLQKLRWYCQMCQKQCRDENGFKCHCLSESHQRQMQIFGYNPSRVVEGFSEEFQRDFLDHLSRSHRHRVAATVVYNEYIANRHHIHMNATRWATLTEFVTHLGREGFCKVDHTEKGWFVTYIDRGSHAVLKERLKAKRSSSDLAYEEREERAVQAQIQRAAALLAASFTDPDPTEKDEPQRKEPDTPLAGKVSFSFHPSNPTKEDDAPKKPKLLFEDEPEAYKIKAAQNSNVKKSSMEELMQEEEKMKERKNRKDYWLHEGIVVKVMSKTLKEKGYYEKKGVVRKVVDRYVGQIEMLDSKHILQVDQDELETVIPGKGRLVMIVNGAYRGSYAKLLDIDEDSFIAKVQIEKGVYSGKAPLALEYEDICKVLCD